MKLEEFSENLEQFIDKAIEAGIPLQDIISELEDIKDSVENQIADNEEEDEEEDGEEDEGEQEEKKEE